MADRPALVVHAAAPVDSRLISVEPVGDVAVVRLQRPPANALDLELLARMLEVLEELRDADPRAVVLVGSGSFFSGGLDVKVLPGLDEDGKRTMAEGINRMLADWYGFPRPVVCAVNGHAVAGGLVLVLCGDRRIGPTVGAFGLTEVRLGVPYPANAIELLRAELTPAAARLLALSPGLVEPAAAQALGVVDELAPPEEVEPRALELAADLATLPGQAFTLTKAGLRAEALASMRRAADGVDPVVRSWVEELRPG